MNIIDIQKILPHRYPFLLVDKVLAVEENKRIRALKNVSLNETFFTGHYPSCSIMPGVLIIEALAQATGILLLKQKSLENKLAALSGVDKMYFKKMVAPGDQLMLVSEIMELNDETCRVKVQATVDHQIVADGELVFSMIE